MRGHYAVGVQSREQGKEGRKQCVAGALGRAPHGHSAVLKSREQGEEYRKQCVAGALGRAPHGHSAVLNGSPLQKVGNREKNVESSAWSLCSGLPSRIARQSCRACRVQGGFSHRDARQNCRAGRAQARQPRTTFFSLLPPPYLIGFIFWVSTALDVFPSLPICVITTLFSITYEYCLSCVC